jgi:CRISPR-associated endonuclease Csn1
VTAPKRGKCALIPAEERLPKALPSVEARALYEIVNSLRFGVGVQVETRLTGAQRDELVTLLLQGRNVTLAKLRKITGAPADARFETAGVKRMARTMSRTRQNGLRPRTLWRRLHGLSLALRTRLYRPSATTMRTQRCLADRGAWTASGGSHSREAIVPDRHREMGATAAV